MLPGLTILVACLAASAADPGAVATRFLERCRDARFAEAVEAFDAKMADVLPASKLAQTWDAVRLGAGDLGSLGPPRVEARGQHAVVLVRCGFARKALDAQVSINPEGKIDGLYFRAPKVTGLAPYVKPGTYAESALIVGAEGWPLGATLAMPEGAGPFPLVVFVHGSGPNDRDETVGANAPFRDLALGLASRGIATLRYDKRTKVHGERMAKLTPTLDEEVVDDALAAVARARTLERVDPRRIFVLGHSLGAVMAPRIARRDGHLAGIIWMAGNVRPIDEVVLDQFRYLSRPEAKPSDAVKDLVRATEADVAAFRADPEKADGKILGAPFAYWKELGTVRPERELAELPGVPVLALQGTRDYQVTMVDFDRLRDALKGRANASFEAFPDLNHLFIAGSGVSGPAEYDRPGHVDVRVVERIAAWIDGTK
ncbi:alpha/beta fold hydrolase [Tundrisphaera sp. TA3]|uniref:alpha/beta hydrolase n=1 Tax=Tundrisphaera sp. TA3 TaxID=3435775 RepID=UPI003EB75FA4